MKYTLLIAPLLTLTIFTGCSDKYDPTPKVIDTSTVQDKMGKNYSMKIKVLAGDSFFDIITRLQNQFKDRIIINKVKDSIIFDSDLPPLNPEEFSKFIKVNFGKTIVMRKYSDKMYSVEEIKNEDKSTDIEVGSYKVPEKRLKINGLFNYAEVFNVLREHGVNLFIDTDEPFNYDKNVSEFTGSIPEFIEFVGAKEKLFVIHTDTGVKLKDIETVTYNLRIPKVKLTPILTTSGAPKSTTAKSVATSGMGVGTSLAVSQTNSDYYSQDTSGSNYKTLDTSISGNREEQSGTTGATETTSPINDLRDQFKVMLEGRGVHSVNLSQGTVSVTGNYDTIKTASRLVKDFNTIYGKGIKLELHVYEVSLDSTKSFGIDYSFLKNELINNSIVKTAYFTTGLSNALTVDPGATSAGLIDMTGSASDGTNVAAARTQGVIFKYLNKFGRATVVTKPTLETINNLPVQLDVTDSLDYVYTLAQTGISTSNTGTTTTATFNAPEIRTVTTGFSIVLHPKIQGDFINVSINNVSSILNNLDTYTYGTDNGSVIRLKDVSSREFSETVKLKEGEIAIIGGYMYEKKHSSKNGLPYTTGEDSSFDALTSAKERTTEKVEIVITISAKVI